MLSGIEAFMDERHLQRIDRELKEKGGSKQSIRIEMINPKTLINRCSIGKSISYQLIPKAANCLSFKHSIAHKP